MVARLSRSTNNWFRKMEYMADARTARASLTHCHHGWYRSFAAKGSPLHPVLILSNPLLIYGRGLSQCLQPPATCQGANTDHATCQRFQNGGKCDEGSQPRLWFYIRRRDHPELRVLKAGPLKPFAGRVGLSQRAWATIFRTSFSCRSS